MLMLYNPTQSPLSVEAYSNNTPQWGETITFRTPSDLALLEFSVANGKVAISTLANFLEGSEKERIQQEQSRESAPKRRFCNIAIDYLSNEQTLFTNRITLYFEGGENNAYPMTLIKPAGVDGIRFVSNVYLRVCLNTTLAIKQDQEQCDALVIPSLTNG